VADVVQTIVNESEQNTRLALWQMKEEIVQSIPATYSPERVSENLRARYGDWTRKIANPRALANAEFLYQARTRGSWGEVVLGYANAIEAEIRAKLLPQLEQFLSANGTTVEETAPAAIPQQPYTLRYVQMVLEGIAKNQLLRARLTSTGQANTSFLLGELPSSLGRLRRLRNKAAHGVVIRDARNIRDLVLGSQERPGLLRKLSDLRLS